MNVLTDNEANPRVPPIMNSAGILFHNISISPPHPLLSYHSVIYFVNSLCPAPSVIPSMFGGAAMLPGIADFTIRITTLCYCPYY